MHLIDYKNLIHSTLDHTFGHDEVESFYGLLCEHYLGFSRIEASQNKNLKLTSEKEKELKLALKKLLKQMPIQYVLGQTEFLGLKFKVNDHVLIPRPETEELVQWIIDDHKGASVQRIILDIGTGSGCIAISLSKFIKNSKVVACDISSEALLIARENASANTVDVEFNELDILAWRQRENPFPKVDVIVSNPPYVREIEKLTMESNVLQYEPHRALFVPDRSPLLFYDTIIEFAIENLNENGILYFEINEYLSRELILLLEHNTFKDIELREDFYGKPRMIKAVKGWKN